MYAGKFIKVVFKLMLQRMKENYNFMWPCLFCESVPSDNWAQTGLN